MIDKEEIKEILRLSMQLRLIDDQIWLYRHRIEMLTQKKEKIKKGKMTMKEIENEV